MSPAGVRKTQSASCGSSVKPDCSVDLWEYRYRVGGGVGVPPWAVGEGVKYLQVRTSAWIRYARSFFRVRRPLTPARGVSSASSRGRFIVYCPQKTGELPQRTRTSSSPADVCHETPLRNYSPCCYDIACLWFDRDPSKSSTLFSVVFKTVPSHSAARDYTALRSTREWAGFRQSVIIFPIQLNGVSTWIILLEGKFARRELWQ